MTKESLVGNLVDHFHVCGRPRYVAGFAALFPGVVTWLDTTQYGAWFHRHTGWPFMVKIVFCSGCHEFWFLSGVGEWLF